MLRKYLYTIGMLFAVMIVAPYLLLKDGNWFADYMSDMFFVTIEAIFAIIALMRFIETKNMFNILLISLFGTTSVIDAFDYFFDKKVDSWIPAIILVTTVFICFVIMFIFWLRPSKQ